MKLFVPDHEAHIQHAFERYATNRGMSLEQTAGSYKTQATKSAWHAWYYLARFGNDILRTNHDKNTY
jgi:hypothetical protein